MQSISRRKLIVLGGMVILVGLMWAGCASTVQERKEGEPKMEGEATGKYYSFEDVRIPRDLEYNQGKSFVYETPRFKAGILYFSKWRLDVNSLIDFFTFQMEKDNWKMVNSFRGKEAVLNFSKPDKTCGIKISERWYGTTEVEIRVGPLGERKM